MGTAVTRVAAVFCWRRCLLEAKSRPEFAAIGAGLVLVKADVTGGPAQTKSRPHGKNDRLRINVGEDAESLGGGRQAEVESRTEDHRVGFAHDMADHGTNDFGFDQKRSRIRPVARRYVQDAASARKVLVFDAGEGTGPGNARHAGSAKFTAFSRVELCGSDGGSPFPIGRAGWMSVTGYIALVHHLEGLDRA